MWLGASFHGEQKLDMNIIKKINILHDGATKILNVRFVEMNMKMVKERDLLQKTCYGSRMIQKKSSWMIVTFFGLTKISFA